MNLLLMADLHGWLPKVTIQQDVIVIAGDIVPVWAANNRYDINISKQAIWLRDTFYPWVNQLPCEHVVMTWGNHDWVGMEPDVLDQIPAPKKLHTLVDEGVTLDGVHFYGSPWQPRFYDWAFNLDEVDLSRRWKLIDDHTDVLVVHGPPKGYGDRMKRGYKTDAPGSESLTRRIKEVEPKLVVCGHIHQAAGSYELTGNSGKSIYVYNCAIVDSSYQPKRVPVEVIL